MPRKRNAPARKGEGVECLLGRNDTPTHSTDTFRLQFLAQRMGMARHRAALIAPLAFGEVGHA